MGDHRDWMILEQFLFATSLIIYDKLVTAEKQTSERERETSAHAHTHVRKHIFNITSERVAPPTINTKIRWPIFLKSLEACLNIESLQEMMGKHQVSTWKR